MSIFSSSSSDEDSAADPRPIGQRDRAEHAHLNPNDPAKEAEAGTPQYGNFGKPNETEPPIPNAGAGGNDGSNDNPDEFSEFRQPDDAGARAYGVNPEDFNPADQVGHATQNQAPEAVRDAQHADVDAQRAAWSEDDPRYIGGHAKSSWTENNEKEHSTND